MLITIEELQIGDEIIVAGGTMKYFKVLKLPKLSTAKSWRGKKYTSVKCSTRKDKVINTYTNYAGNPRTYERIEFIVSAEDHNTTQYVDLNYRSIWLVKRENY